MATLVVWSNYEIIDGVKVFGEMRTKRVHHVRKIAGVSEFDSAKIHLWVEIDGFRNEFKHPTKNGETYDFNPTEMDLESWENERFGKVEGFDYDDGTTMYSASIYENYNL